MKYNHCTIHIFTGTYSHKKFIHFKQLSCFTVYHKIHMPLPFLRLNSIAQDIEDANVQAN